MREHVKAHGRNKNIHFDSLDTLNTILMDGGEKITLSKIEHT